MKKKNLTNLGQDLGQLVHMVTDWVDFRVAYYFLCVSRFLKMINTMVAEGNLQLHRKVLVERVLENVPAMPTYFLLRKYRLNR